MSQPQSYQPSRCARCLEETTEFLAIAVAARPWPDRVWSELQTVRFPRVPLWPTADQHTVPLPPVPQWPVVDLDEHQDRPPRASRALPPARGGQAP